MNDNLCKIQRSVIVKQRNRINRLERLVGNYLNTCDLWAEKMITTSTLIKRTDRVRASMRRAMA